MSALRQSGNHAASGESQTTNASLRVLFVDLDGTLIKSDLLYEGIIGLLTKSIGLFLRTLFQLVHGRAVFKRAITAAITADAEHLPLRREVVDFIQQQHLAGREIVLATASDSAWAQRIAERLSVFSAVLASDGTVNLKGQAKLLAIQKYCREHGYIGFDYIGDSRADLPIWREASGVYLVCPSNQLLAKVSAFSKPAGVLGSRKSRIVAAFWALRPHQWVKNLLVFVPIIASHNVLRSSVVLPAILAFISFCLCASAVYILNDLIDLPADRRHPTKCKRPFASGALPVIWGLPLFGGLLSLALLISGLRLPASFSLSLAGYFLATCTYSFFAKRRTILDVIILAGLYTIRVLAGGLATGIVVSEWLMAFSMFLFVSLAFAKRYAELFTLSRAGRDEASGRDYRVSDLRFLESLGPASGYIAVLVLALYINGDQMKALYRDPRPLWLTCVALMYWIGRVWIIAMRGELFDDPIVFALRDRVSLLLGAVLIILLAVASYHM